MSWPTRVAVIIDLVGSRRQRDRAWLHRTFVTALAQVDAMVPGEQPLAPTVGDEAQARYHSVNDALRATLLLRLVLPEGLDCRAGIGVGEVQDLGPGVAGLLQDGPGWWAARDAINEAKARELVKDRTLRTWYLLADEAEPGSEVPSDAVVQALLLTRDEIVSSMQERSRRLLLGVLQGVSQADLALQEGISASAVSQNLRRSGAYAVLHAHDRLDGRGVASSVAPEPGGEEEGD
ncbi:SatD family protein [Aeromicrobium sp. Root495]|uniref:SatD family protein n=1 Tax=Aeromicrobium sp. Root495 TaxID=1736550 RepID=UPI00138F4EC1|nr:SatD family protein [Aeromicrobium sp. Root495]